MNELQEDLTRALVSPQFMSDEEIERRTRAIMVDNGHPEAATCDHSALVTIVIEDFRARGEPLFPLVRGRGA